MTDRLTDGLTDTGGCRVAFATENRVTTNIEGNFKFITFFILNTIINYAFCNLN